MNDNEILAASTDELRDGQMKEISWNENKIILTKVEGNYFAVSGTCPHYKAPLIKGALCGKRLYCPWHHSSFDVTKGNLCDPPALDGLPHYNLRIENNEIFIQIPHIAKETSQTSSSSPDNRTFVVIGGGAAGLMAAETLRSEGFAGKLILITKENELPYDRTALSKKYVSGKAKGEELLLRKEEFFQEKGIEIEKNKKVKSVNVSTHTIQFEDGISLTYNALLIATGGEPNQLTIEGANLKNVFTLRSFDDAKTILAEAKKAKKVCIIGASFIAMEVAASLSALGLRVTVLSKEALPFEKNFGSEIGKMFLNMHTGKGVVIKTNVDVDRIKGKEEAEAVILKSGERIQTDLVIAGIGVHPQTDFITGVEKNKKDKSILADNYLQVADGLYVAGDIANYFDTRTGKHIRVEHWRLAQQHGRMAALNMLGKKTSVSTVVPFFWTNQFDKRLSYVGHAEDWDEIVVDGDISQQKFIAFYMKEGKVLAAASMNRDTDSDKIEDAMRTSEKLVTIDELKKAIET